MNLISLKHRYDFGHDFYLQVLNVKGWSLLQASVSWNDYPSYPYLQVYLGNGTLFGVLFWCWKFGFDVDILRRTWNFDYLGEEQNDVD